MGAGDRSRFVPPPGWPAPPPRWIPPVGWRPDPSWPPAPAGHRFWRTAPRHSWRGRIGIAGLVLITGFAGLAAAGWALDEFGHPIYGPNACNDEWDGGNDYIEGALIDRLPEGTLRSYMNTGADCDDRRTGSVAAAWTDQARPAAVVDLLVRAGWSRTDPPGGPPTWYFEDALASDPIWHCLVQSPGVWQSPGLEEYATRSCSHPSTKQIVLTVERGPRIFVARFGPYGMTVDVAHKRDRSGARQIRAGQLPGEDY